MLAKLNKILNRELQNINQMSETRETRLPRYFQNILETATKASYFQIFPFYYETNTSLK